MYKHSFKLTYAYFEEWQWKIDWHFSHALPHYFLLKLYGKTDSKSNKKIYNFTENGISN